MTLATGADAGAFIAAWRLRQQRVIARAIFTAHGGTLTARNRTPHGALFIGSLPCGKS